MLYWVGSLQCFSVITFGSFSSNDRDPFTELENLYLFHFCYGLGVWLFVLFMIVCLCLHVLNF